MVILNGLKVGLEDREELQESSVFIHCIPLSCGEKKKLEEDEVGLISQRSSKDLCLRGQSNLALTRDCDKKGTQINQWK